MQTPIARRLRQFSGFLGTVVLWTLSCHIWLSAQERPSLNSQPSAEIRIPAAALPQSVKLETVFQQGENLEKSRRWGDALAHYQDAIKSFPGHPDLQQRFSQAQTHCDVARRYADTSFTSCFQRYNEQKTVEIYGEILTKIQTYYVESPNWRQLVQRGTESLLIAMTEPAFVQTHFQQLTAEKRLEVADLIRKRLAQRQITSRYQAQQVVREIAQLAQQKTGLRPEACILEYACGALMDLDIYSSFLTASQLTDVFSQIEGNFVGLGIELKCEVAALRIVKVIADGPAHQAGLKAGDRIVTVNRRTVRETTPDVAADMLRGSEGSQVRISVVGVDNQTSHFNLRRQRVEVPSVENVKILVPDAGIAYFKITNFQKTTERSVDAALWKLHRAGMRGLILDLRGNPGGLLNASVDLADKFLSTGLIVSTRGRSAQEDVDYRAHDLGTWKTPLVVLIDRDSASASEIFAGAVHDHRRALVVGERSYGKGSVQGIFPLTSSGAGIRLTTAKFYTPNGNAISHQGVSPDVPVRRADKPQLTASGLRRVQADPMLDTAIELLRKEVQLAAGQR